MDKTSSISSLLGKAAPAAKGVWNWGRSFLPGAAKAAPGAAGAAAPAAAGAVVRQPGVLAAGGRALIGGAAGHGADLATQSPWAADQVEQIPLIGGVAGKTLRTVGDVNQRFGGHMFGLAGLGVGAGAHKFPRAAGKAYSGLMHPATLLGTSALGYMGNAEQFAHDKTEYLRQELAKAKGQNVPAASEDTGSEARGSAKINANGQPSNNVVLYPGDKSIKDHGGDRVDKAMSLPGKGTAGVNPSLSRPNETPTATDQAMSMYSGLPNWGKAGLIGAGALGLGGLGSWMAGEEDDPENPGEKRKRAPYLGPLLGLGALGAGAYHMSDYGKNWGQLRDPNFWMKSGADLSKITRPWPSVGKPPLAQYAKTPAELHSDGVHGITTAKPAAIPQPMPYVMDNRGRGMLGPELPQRPGPSMQPMPDTLLTDRSVYAGNHLPFKPNAFAGHYKRYTPTATSNNFAIPGDMSKGPGAGAAMAKPVAKPAVPPAMSKTSMPLILYPKMKKQADRFRDNTSALTRSAAPPPRPPVPAPTPPPVPQANPLQSGGASADAATANPFVQGGGESAPSTSPEPWSMRQRRQANAMNRLVNTGPQLPGATSGPPAPTPPQAPPENPMMPRQAQGGIYHNRSIIAGTQTAGSAGAGPLTQLNPEVPNRTTGAAYQHDNVQPTNQMPATVPTTATGATRQPPAAYNEGAHPRTLQRMDGVNAAQAQYNQENFGRTGLKPQDDETYRRVQNQPPLINNVVSRIEQLKPEAGDENVRRMQLYRQLDGKVPPDTIMGTVDQIMSNLTEPQKWMLGIGLSLGAVGLLSSMSGMMGGPNMGMLGPLLAIGGLGYGAYQSGLLGNLTGGALGPTNAGWSGQPRPAKPIDTQQINAQELFSRGMGSGEVPSIIKELEAGGANYRGELLRHDPSAQAMMRNYLKSSPGALAKLNEIYAQQPSYQQAAEHNRAWDQQYGGPTAIAPNTPPGASPQASAAAQATNPPATEVKAPGGAGAAGKPMPPRTPGGPPGSVPGAARPPGGPPPATARPAAPSAAPRPSAPPAAGVNPALTQEIQKVKSNPIFAGLITPNGQPNMPAIEAVIRRNKDAELKPIWSAMGPEMRKAVITRLQQVQQKGGLEGMGAGWRLEKLQKWSNAPQANAAPPAVDPALEDSIIIADDD